MQKATRNTFTQKGSEVQKIIQSGIWAYVESSYLNPNFDSACNGYEVGEGEGRIISVAKWIYRCKRLLRKSNHIAVSVDNGEVLEPCYLIEPSSEDRLQDKTLVWLEPLPQLNGYVIIPGGTSQCGEGYGSGYYSYGSGVESGLGSSFLDCDSLLNCLCVEKNSEGRVTGLFVKKPNGTLKEIEECFFDWECFPKGPYVVDYQFQINGEQYSGTSDIYTENAFNFSDVRIRLDSPSLGRVLIVIVFRYDFTGGIYPSIRVSALGDPYYCIIESDDIDTIVSGCPGLPTAYSTILPGRCISGSFIFRPAGTRREGGGRGYSPCCPTEHLLYFTPYVAQYDFTINNVGARVSGYSYLSRWVGVGRLYLVAINRDICSPYLHISFSLYCNRGIVFASVVFYCPNEFNILCVTHMQPGYDDWEFSSEGCPDLPTFYFTAKPRSCVSGWFKVMPYRP